MSADVAFYGNLLGDIKTRIRQAQYRAATAVNTGNCQAICRIFLDSSSFNFWSLLTTSF